MMGCHVLGKAVEVEANMKFTMPANEELVLKGDTINGVIGSLVNHTLPAHEIYFSGNHAVCISKTGYYLAGPCVAVDMVSCPEVDPEGDYDFSICLGDAAETADGIDVAKTVEKVSQPGNSISLTASCSAPAQRSTA